jgi:uncharacterized protein (TIGR02246 family)
MGDEAEIRSVENARIAALLAGDSETLANLLADDLVHVHANGLQDSKETYLATITAKLDFLKLERSDLTIRLAGDVAIVTGPFDQTMRLRDSGAVVEMHGILTQVWVKQDGKWLQNTFHAGRIG